VCQKPIASEFPVEHELRVRRRPVRVWLFWGCSHADDHQGDGRRRGLVAPF